MKDVEPPEFTEWIPPDRPLSGNSDNEAPRLFPHVLEKQRREGEDDEEWELRVIAEELRHMEQQEKEAALANPRATTQSAVTHTNEEKVDWLKTRRSALGQEDGTSGIDMMTPNEAVSRKQDMSDIPVKMHTLLSKDEIATCLDALGGRNITVVLDNPKLRRMGGPNGMVFVTVSTNTQMRTLADALVRQMRRRKLQNVGVLGAELGPEGNTDSDETWMVVDCMNYIVHLQDKKTRKALDLEGLWSGKDPLHKIDTFDEEAVEKYVEDHPVPGGYGQSAMDWDETVKRLQKNRWTAPHRPVITRNKTKRNR
jgi:ribosomal silencing factor RsfS